MGWRSFLCQILPPPFSTCFSVSMPSPPSPLPAHGLARFPGGSPRKGWNGTRKAAGDRGPGGWQDGLDSFPARPLGGNGHSVLQPTAPPGPSFHQPQRSPGLPEHLLTPSGLPWAARASPDPPIPWAAASHPTGPGPSPSALGTPPGPRLHRVFTSLSTLRLVT